MAAARTKEANSPGKGQRRKDVQAPDNTDAPGSLTSYTSSKTTSVRSSRGMASGRDRRAICRRNRRMALVAAAVRYGQNACRLGRP